MRHLILAVSVFIWGSLPCAADGDLVLRHLKEKNAVQLTGEDLNKVLPNAKVTHLALNGSRREWINESSGKFMAFSDSRGQTGAQGRAQGDGTWRIDDQGRYCAAIEWRRVSEKWCLYIFKLGDKYYGVRSLKNEDSKAGEFGFSK